MIINYIIYIFFIKLLLTHYISIRFDIVNQLKHYITLYNLYTRKIDRPLY